MIEPKMNFEEEAKASNPYIPGTPKHWALFAFRKNEREPVSGIVPSRFQVVQLTRHRHFNHPERQAAEQLILEAASEAVTRNDDVVVLYDCAVFMTADQAVIFKLKASELLA